MRKTFLILAAAFLLSAVAASRVFAADDTWTKTFTISGTTPQLRLDADFGDVHILPCPSNSIQVTVNTYRWRIAPSEVQVTGTQDGNHVEIRIETPKRNEGWFHWHTPKLIVELQVPSGSDLDLHTGFGDITGDNLHATARLDTGFGKIRFSAFTGELTAGSGFGDINADGCFERLRLKTGFGDVRVAVYSGSRMNEDWRLESGFGSLRVRVPSDLNANVDAQSGFGHVSTDVPLTLSENSGHSSVRGRLGSGGMALELSTGFGSVHIGRT